MGASTRSRSLGHLDHLDAGVAHHGACTENIRLVRLMHDDLQDTSRSQDVTSAKKNPEVGANSSQSKKKGKKRKKIALYGVSAYFNGLIETKMHNSRFMSGGYTHE